MLIVPCRPRRWTVTATLLPGATSPRHLHVTCCCPFTLATLKIGAWLLPNVTFNGKRVGQRSEQARRNDDALNVRAMPGAVMVAMLAGESAPAWKSAPLTKLLPSGWVRRDHAEMSSA